MLHPGEIIVDSFAGGGGASLGIEAALGRPVDVAVNHDPAAIAMHRANHPRTRHYTEDVFKAAPRRVTGGRPVGLLWASPDCRHHSRAKGSKPVEKRVRGLAWVVVKWAVEAAPRVVVLENVREFAEWGPVVPRWLCGACRWRGTEGQTRLARTRRRCPACDSPRLAETADLVPDPARKGLTFRRFVGRLRGLGYEVQWRTLNAADYGAPTHRRRLFLVARRDGEPIVWPEPTHGDPRKIEASRGDLFPSDLRPWRTAAECIDWSIPCPSIFTRKRPLAEKTLRRIAAGVKRYVIDNPTPFVVDAQRENRPRGVGEPLGTVTTQGNRFSLVAPTLYPRNGERPGQPPRCGSVEAPLPTVVATGNGAQLVAAFVAKHYGGAVGVPAAAPLPTTTARGTQNQLAVANLVHLTHGGKTAGGLDDPARTVAAGGTHAALVCSFIAKYFGSGGQWQGAGDPLHTSTGKARFGLVTVAVAGEEYVLADIGMRMLKPRELARAQGFPDGYQLTGTLTSQVERVGNSVCPPVAAAVVAAQFSRLPAGVAS